MKNKSLTLLMILLAILPPGYLYWVYPSLPPTIPTHFGFDGQANGYSDKPTIIWITLFISFLSVGSYFLIKNLSRIDPKRTAAMGSANLQKIAVAVVALLSAVMIIILYSSVHGNFSFNFFNPIMGMFFIVVGNLMYNIKPNYFVGIRIPWTLENPDNWRATHHLGGKLWVAGGIFILISALFFKGRTNELLFMVTTAILVLVPIIYSFVYFRKHRMAK
jgi:uncharacterized membrane protein